MILITRAKIYNSAFCWLLSTVLFCFHCQVQANDTYILEKNKQIARNFYNDLWFSNNTEKYDKYVADTYVVHDTGDRKNVTEHAIEQKHIADFFWKNGDLSGDIQYQIAEGDLVATKWRGFYEPKTMLGKLLAVEGGMQIINVFRFKEGKIIEIWNHRHDIDTPQTMKFTVKGFMFGLLVALVPTLWAISLRRRLKRTLDRYDA
ncbi:ester cyclase [uncultured Paraglaciecola sp.]|uniref:nuclear transport factor 2 family protein n=1 Tax=uncultured Paraglaciecola sp. TaxID=1765024 RepID=UPI00262E636B|nr:ester cyclase [uncultured Paraglaciecola sp.]